MLSVKTSTILLHFIGWVLLFGLIVGFTASMRGSFAPESLFAFPFLLFMAVYLFLFYFNAYVLVPRFYLRQEYTFYFVIIALLLLGVAWLQPFDKLNHIGPGRGFDGRPPSRPSFDRGPFDRPGHRPGRHKPLIDITSIILFLMVWAVSTAMQIIRQWRSTEQRAIQAEADKANAELSFLKAQIHPHFLFNTLNNIYSLAVTKSDRTPDAILKLSNIMRYVTDEVGQDFVPLQHEVACIGDYIDLQRLRLSEKAMVNFLVKGNLEGKEVPPLILMTFVENVFKYGISSHEPSPITIHVATEDKTIVFYSQNRIFETPRQTERIGIGINNTKQRLEHLYPYKHILTISTDGGLYTVQLTLQV